MDSAVDDKEPTTQRQIARLSVPWSGTLGTILCFEASVSFCSTVNAPKVDVLRSALTLHASIPPTDISPVIAVALGYNLTIGASMAAFGQCNRRGIHELD